MIVKEIDRARVNGQTVVKYHLFVSNLPKDSEYTLWWKLPGTEPQTVASAFINKDGLVVNVLADPTNNVAEDSIDLIVVAGRGEPKEFGLISNDGKGSWYWSRRYLLTSNGSWFEVIVPVQ
jgi:hypothetical protein